ncbi:DUF2971 domain-containing protein [Haladaptatus sp. YSMS36]|uniref:DUF2971 domain-containing protein n=1 Tax=Haladaptatus sp. YSMS36 TaxID=3033384 RepID=UPI0023E8E660|nr:DUF2971 domain-containing protein [Haladaptatus sp. YSMS36]
MTIVYRFRPMDYLLDKHHEIEKQELVLSSPRNLNDPIEGYQDVYWEGDEVLWKNLLRHYLLNLLWASHTCAIWDDDTFEEHAIQPMRTREDIPSDDFRNLYDSVCQAFFDERGFSTIASSLASLPRSLKRDSLQLVLSFIHRSALASVLETLRDSSEFFKTWPTVTNPTSSDTTVTMLYSLSDMMADGDEPQALESIASIFGTFKSSVTLSQALQGEVDEIELSTIKAHFLFVSFPSRYIANICDSLIHPNWHTLCFSKECTSLSMWAGYADEHRGAALMFRTDSQSDKAWAELKVNEQTGSSGSGPTNGEIRAPLHAVDYESPPPEVDFFRFLGQLPAPTIISEWYSTPDGKESQLADEFLEDKESWREDLWNHFSSMSTTKLGQWKHEEEIRMVLPDLLGSHGSLRKVTYDLSQLAGVVFGLRTSLENRFEVMRILNNKMQDSDSPPVDFYEMVFDGKNFRKVKIVV